MAYQEVFDHNELKNTHINVNYNDVMPGMCGTMYVGSDRYPIVVVERVSPKRIKIAHMKDEDIKHTQFDKNHVEILPQEYFNFYLTAGGYYKPITYTFRSNNTWSEKGSSCHYTGHIYIGRAYSYLDPSF